jgi:predicted nucleic acid binding AN1-type Zn finger protein
MSNRGEKISENEWTDKSKRVEVCGMFGCQENPTSQCPDCANHYCYEHIKSHVHRIWGGQGHIRREVASQQLMTIFILY